MADDAEEFTLIEKTNPQYYELTRYMWYLTEFKCKDLAEAIKMQDEFLK